MVRQLSGLALILWLLIAAATGYAAETEIINIYDANGNLVTGDGRYYEYNDANQLARVRQGDQAGPVIAEYVYDAAGQRVKKIENGVVTYYIGKHYEKQVGGSNAGNTSYYFGEGGERVAKKDPAGNIFYYHLDHLAGINVVTDSVGTEVSRTDYLPFGDLRTGSSDSEKYLYTGKEKDKTSLYYFNARYNSPEFRHFTQADIAEPDYADPQDLNRYAYVGNNPLSYVDYDGFKKKKKKAKLSKREKWMIAHGADPDKDKTSLKKAKKLFKEGKKYTTVAKSEIMMSSSVAYHSESNGTEEENYTEDNSTSSKSNSSQHYSAEDIRNIWMDQQNNMNCGMNSGFKNQETGCDNPADKLNMSPEALKCCAIHDACYTEHRCNSSSWLAGCGSCQEECNMEVISCLKRVAKEHPIKLVVSVLKALLTGGE